MGDDYTYVVRRRASPNMVRLGFGAVCVVVGIAVGSVITFATRSGSTPTVSAAPPAAPIVQPLPAPATPPQPARVAVRIDSEPQGALTTLVDGGKPISLGPTPLVAQLDPAKHYEVVLSLADHRTNVQAIDPAKDQRVVVVLASVK